MKQTLFMRQLDAYFENYLPEVKMRSKNTISAYGDSFRLLFEFFEQQKNIPHYLIDYKHLTIDAFDDFVIWLGKERKCGEASKKHRLSAVSSFLKYASRREISALKALNSIMGIDKPSVPRSRFPYFSVEETKILLGLPNPRERLGVRDMMLLSLLYDSGARAQELCDIKVCDIRFTSPAKIGLLGKGNKAREIPISDEVSELLKYYLKSVGLNNPENRNKYLFFSQTHEKMTTSCIRGIVKKYVGAAKRIHPNLFGSAKYSPHSFRHSKAVHMVEADNALIYIRDFLGHETVRSTEIYARVSQDAVTKALTERKIPVLSPKVDSLEKNSHPQQFPKFLSRRK